MAPRNYTENLLTAGWLPPRTRAKLSRDIAARNALDRALATARGIPADAPECARFQGPVRHDQLDAAVRAARRGAP